MTTYGAIVAITYVISGLALIQFGLPRFARQTRGTPPLGQVFGSVGHMKAGAAILWIFVGLVATALVFAKPLDGQQFLIWISITGVCIATAGALLSLGWRIRAMFDQYGLIYRTNLGRKQSFAWSELTLRRSSYGAAIAFKAKGWDELGFSGDEPGLPDLLAIAFEAGVNRSENFVRRRQT